MLMWIAVTKAKAIATEMRDGGPVREAAEDRFDDLRQRGLAEEPDPDRGDGDADLTGGERFVDAVELLDHGLGAALAFLGELFDFAAPAADEGELGGNEESVDRHQHQQEDEQENAHELFGPVLRGRSSSAIRRREYSFLGMRIASLVPSATEMLFALGLGDSVVGVTHECDYPPAARSLPHLTRTVLPPGLDAAEIDRAVKATIGEGRPLYALEEAKLAELEPDLIVTQSICEVCAVSYEDVVAVAARLPGPPRVVEQDPSTLAETLEDIVRARRGRRDRGGGARTAR